MTTNIKDSAFNAYEEYVLKEKNISEGLKNLVEGSDSHKYLKCIDLLTKKGASLTQDEKDFIENYISYNNTPEQMKIALRWNLLKYDAANSEEEKEKLIAEFNKTYIRLDFDHQRPGDLYVKSSGKEKSESETGKETKNLFDELNLTEELERLYNRQKNISDFEKNALAKVELDRLQKNDFFSLLKIMDKELLRLDSNPKFYDTFSKWLKENYNQSKYFNIEESILINMTVEQMDKLKDKTPGLNEDNSFVSHYFTKKFNRELSDEANLHLSNKEKRDHLIKMYEYSKALPYHLSGLKSSLLLEILEYGLKINEFAEQYFVEYLKLPIRNNYIKTSSAPNVGMWNKCIGNVQVEHNRAGSNSSEIIEKDKELLTKYLEYFFLQGTNINKFTDYLDQKFLIEVLENTMLMSGQKVEFKVENTSRLEQLAASSSISIGTENKDVFEIGEDISLLVDLKNIPTLFIKVFEINTENYYRKNLGPFKTDVNLDGLIASIERTAEFTKPPFLKFKEELKFPELKGRVGLYVIELIGNGKSSRAVIKIGTLSIIARQTVAGQVCYILDGERKVCCHESTGIWMNNQYFKADLEKDGRIIIPYLSSGGNKNEKAILLHQGLAQLVDIQRTEEVYSLKCGYYLLTESVILGQYATFLIRPQLFINERLANLELLKNIKCILYTENYIDNIPSTKSYTNLVLSDSKELTIQFQVGANMKNMKIEFSAEVQNVTKNVKQVLSDTYHYDFVTHTSENSIAELYLRINVPHDYELFVLGKNGEPIANSIVKLNIKTNNLVYPKELTAVTNDQGMIKLGKMKGVIQFTATLTLSSGRCNITRTWTLPSKTVMQYPMYIDIVEDEDVDLPISTEHAEENLLLRSVHNNLTLFGFSDKIKVISDKNLLYSTVKISGLKTGVYLLTGLGSKHIQIRVHKGVYWAENQNYILKKYSLLENGEKQGFIKIKTVNFENEEGKARMKMQIEGATKDKWRVHVMLFRYLPQDLNELTLRLLSKDSFVGTEYYFQKWKNFYLSNRELSSEFRYCFDRLYQQRYTGNMLDKPKLALKRTFIRNTTAQQEVVSEGGTYYKTQEQVPIPPMQQMQQLPQPPGPYIPPPPCCAMPTQNIIPAPQQYRSMAQSELRLGGFAGVPHYGALPQGSSRISDKIYPYQDFLKVKPMLLYNVPASEDGNVVVELSEEYKEIYGCALILAVDKGSVAHYMCPLPGNQLPKQDRSLIKALDPEKLYSEMRTAKCINKYETHIIEDIASTKFQIVDSLEKVFLVIKELTRLYSKRIDDLDKFENLLQWNTLEEDEKNKIMSKYTSHELHLFIYKKDPGYFNKVVRPYLRNKMEKTFMDYYLLGNVSEMLKFANSLSLLSTMNPLEKALLVEVLAKNGKKEIAQPIVQRMKNALLFRMKTANEQNRIFDTVISLGLLKPKKEEIQKFAEEEKESISLDSSNVEQNQISYEPMAKNVQAYCNIGFGGARTKQTARISTNNANAYQTGKKPMLPLQELGETKEYAETNYYNNTSAKDWSKVVSQSEFWVDYAEFFVSPGNEKFDKPFLTHQFITAYNKLTEIIAAISLLDMPFHSLEHGFKTLEGRNAEFKAADNLIIFQKEIKETKGDIRNNILVAQQYVDWERTDDKEGEIEEFLTNHIYMSRTIITNVSPNRLEFDVLLQIPQGSLPIGAYPYQRSYSLYLDGYTTSPSKYEYMFYFPQPGKFVHFPPNISTNSTVIAKANTKIITVLKEKTRISETNFRDVVSTGNYDLILNFIKEKPIDSIKGFRWRDIYWLLKDYAFYEPFVSVLRSQKLFESTVWSYSLYHMKREDLIIEYLDSLNHIKPRFGYYFDSKIIQVRPIDSDMRHLDYYPLINPRAHKNLLGSASNINQPMILNDALYDTYKKFILYMIEKPVWDLADKMSLMYYLLLQDKVKEALKIYEKINPETEIKNEERLKLQYDYMTAYLDFYLGAPEFKTARKIVAEYLEYPLIAWQLLFLDIEQQLKDYDGIEIDEDQEAETREMMKMRQLKAEPILTIELEGKTVLINYNNMPEVAIKYYIINLEMLFSHTPFLAQNAEDFSYVKPNSSEIVKLDPKMKQYVLKIPESYSTQNVLIEVNSGALQRLVTYFSTSLKLQIFENYGELKVVDESDKQLPQVYVKVFIMKHDGKVTFYKDGYTDIRGRFDYASINESKIGNIKKFALFIMSDKYGSLIRECQPPASTMGHEEQLGPVKARLASYYNKKMK